MYTAPELCPEIHAEADEDQPATAAQVPERCCAAGGGLSAQGNRHQAALLPAAAETAAAGDEDHSAAARQVLDAAGRVRERRCAAVGDL